MDGEGFAVVVAKGERIAAGEPLATVDFGKVAAAGHSVVVVDHDGLWRFCLFTSKTSFINITCPAYNCTRYTRDLINFQVF